MNTDLFSIPIIIVLTVGFITVIWGLRLWITPAIYDHESFFYRQAYLWYEAWFNRDVDESYQPTDEEIRKIGKLLVLIWTITILISLTLSFFVE